jgi:excisionase family DNA binding protein
VTVVVLDDAECRVIVVALERLARSCRVDGMPVPPAVADVIAALGDHRRQQATDSPVVDVDGGIVPVQPLLVDIDHAAAMLAVSARQVERLVANGELRSVIVGARARRIRRDDLEEYVSRLRDRTCSPVSEESVPPSVPGVPAPAGASSAAGAGIHRIDRKETA